MFSREARRCKGSMRPASNQTSEFYRAKLEMDQYPRRSSKAETRAPVQARNAGCVATSKAGLFLGNIRKFTELTPITNPEWWPLEFIEQNGPFYLHLCERFLQIGQGQMAKSMDHPFVTGSEVESLPKVMTPRAELLKVGDSIPAAPCLAGGDGSAIRLLGLFS